MSVLAVTDQEFQDSLKQNDKVIVKYYADWCGSWLAKNNIVALPSSMLMPKKARKPVRLPA
jgi:hypothetical protein